MPLRAGVLLALLGAGPALCEAELRGYLDLTLEADRFGGFSGLELSQDGRSAVAIGDRGTILRFGLTRDSAGDVVAATDLRLARLRTIGGEPLPGHLTDAEGLAETDGGRLFLSFENTARVAEYDATGRGVRTLPRHPDFDRLQGNSGLEALAIDDSGAILAIPERSGALDRPYPIYRWDGESWDIAGEIPRQPPHLVTGADIGPDGRLYVLERHFTGLVFRSRVRRFAPDGSNGETLIDLGGLGAGNLEGIAVWRDGAGALRITMIADDNFSPLQATHVVEYVLSD